MGEGTKMRLEFLEYMRMIAPGAKVARRTGSRARVWTVTRQQRVDCGAWLTLQHGRRSFRVYVRSA